MSGIRIGMLKLLCLTVLSASALAGAHFENAVVVLAGSATTPQKKAAQMLVEEIEKRTQLRLKISPDAIAAREIGNTPDPVEFEIPQQATATGTLTLEWRGTPGQGGNGSGTAVSEVWLMKVANGK